MRHKETQGTSLAGASEYDVCQPPCTYAPAKADVHAARAHDDLIRIHAVSNVLLP